MAATKTDDEADGEKFVNRKTVTPSWGGDAKNGAHLWCRSSASGDFCFIGNSECKDRGPRLKCSACKIVVHTECLKILIGKEKVLCRKTFMDAEDESYREKTDIPHHWTARKNAKGKCRTCSKNLGGKMCNLLSETVGTTCSWCKEVYHNKEMCYDMKKMNSGNCTLGHHSKLIVPPTWIIKLQETENSDQVFTVKPIPSTKQSPLLVFINPKSGGNQGSRLLKTFQWLLNPRQVFDLTEGGPKLGLELYKRVPNLRILACGGDGTVGWILSVLDNLKLSAAPPVCVLPLGTGNDLARALGWGGGYTDEPIKKILANIEGGEIVKLDRWFLDVSPNEKAQSNNNEEGRKTLPLTVVNNYFSLGVDALIALEFHEAREAHPKKFNSRIRNKMFYGQAGGKDLIQRKWKDLSSFVTLECDGQDMTPKLKELKVHAILFLNICSYGGGTRPWGASGHNQFKVPSTEDGLMEVIGLTTYQLPLLQAGGHGSPIAQCRSAKLTTFCTIPIQVDGEPCRLAPSHVNITLLNTVNMIARTKKHGAPMTKQSVEKISLPAKLISLPNYETEHNRKAALKEGAVDFGTVTINYNTDLSEIRPDVSKLLEEKEIARIQEAANKIQVPESGRSSRRASKVTSWWFLDSCSGARFFRIHEAQEHLYYVNDICDEVLYVLEQRESADDDATSNSLRVEPEGDDVSRLSSSSSGRESGDEKNLLSNASRNDSGYNQGKIKKEETVSAVTCKKDFAINLAEDSTSIAVAQVEHAAETESEGGPEPVTAPTSPIISPVYSPSHTQIFVDPGPEMEEAGEKGLRPLSPMDTLLVPDKRASITSLKLNPEDMDLITAAKFGNLNRVAELHNSGVSLGERDKEGRTALHHAAFIGNIDVVRYLAVYSPITVLDAQDDMTFHTALHRAALRGDYVICSILVSAGAALDIKDKQGQTAKELAEAIGAKKLAEYLESVTEFVIL